jgi:hypothetical protein
MVYSALLSPGFTPPSDPVNPYERRFCRAGQIKARAKSTAVP